MVKSDTREARMEQDLAGVREVPSMNALLLLHAQLRRHQNSRRSARFTRRRTLAISLHIPFFAAALLGTACHGKGLGGSRDSVGFQAHLSSPPAAAGSLECEDVLSASPAELRLDPNTALVVDAPRLRRQGEHLVLTGRVLIPLPFGADSDEVASPQRDTSLLAVVFDSRGDTRLVRSPDASLVIQQGALVRLRDGGHLSALWLPFLDDDPRRAPAILGGYWDGTAWTHIDSVVRPSRSNRLDFPEVIDAGIAIHTELAAVARWFESERSFDALVRASDRGWTVSSAALPFSPRLAVVARDSSQLVGVGIQPSRRGGATIAVWLSSNGGRSWGGPTPIEAASAVNVQPPSLVKVAGDTLVAAWAADVAGAAASVREIHAAVSVDGGVSWRSVRPFRLDHEIWGIDLTSDSRGRVAVAVSTAAFEGTMSLRPEVLVLTPDASNWRRIWRAPADAPAMGVATLAADVNDDLVVLYAPTPGNGYLLRPAQATVIPSNCSAGTP